MWTNYKITDPFNPTQVHLNGTVNGDKHPFANTTPGCGTSYWGGLSLPGTSIPVQLESTEPLTYNATALARFTRSSTSISYTYSANQTGTYWSSSFSTSSVGSGYNLTIPYHSKWTNVKVFRNGTDVTVSASIAGGNIIVPSSTAAGSNSWTITARSTNRVSSVSFDQAIYYRGQTMTVSVIKNINNLQTELVSFYDPSGVQRGATIGTNFPLGIYTAVYWCENGTDAGFATTTVSITDNGSVSIHLRDSLGRDVPGSLVNITSTKQIAWTDAVGRATITDVTYGSYTMVFSDPARGSLGSTPVTVGASSVQVDYNMLAPYIFAQVPMVMTFTDRFGDPFPAVVSISNTTRVMTTTSASGTASSGGFLSKNLDEGTYSISAQYPSGTPIVLNSSSFTVRKDVWTSFQFQATGIDSNPIARTGTLRAIINDSLGRYIEGLSVEITGASDIVYGVTDARGEFSTPIYWGNGTSVSITWSDASGTVATLSTTISTTGTKDAIKTLLSQYIYQDIQVTFSVQDKFNNGYPARIVVNNGTNVINATANSGGVLHAILDEGTYTVTVYYPGMTLIGTYPGIVVRRGTGTTFLLSTTIDAHPLLHSTTVETTIKDAIGRWIDGINVTLVGTSWNGTGITGIDGKVIFYNVYWGYSTSFTVTWRDIDNTILNISVMTIVSTAMKTLPTVLVSQYFYKGLVISFSTIDRFGNGFIADIKHVDDVPIVTTTATGTGNAVMDEGTWIVRVVYNSRIVNDTIYITVRKNTGQSFILIAPIDAYPSIHSTTVSVSVKDNAGRLLPGINTTLSNVDGIRWAMTGTDGKVIFSNVYWGNSTSFTSSWIAPNSTVLLSKPITIGTTSPVSWMENLTRRYLFPSIPITISITDKFSDGFPARVILVKGTTIYNDTIGSGGVLQISLDEGVYQVTIKYPGSMTIQSSSLIVVKDTGTTFNYPFSFDAHPAMHSATIVAHLEDNASRYIYGVQCIATNGQGIVSSTTDDAGNATMQVYWGNFTSYVVSWNDGSTISTFPITISQSKVYYIDQAIGFRYRFTDLRVEFNVTDKNDIPYPALFKIYEGAMLVSTGGANAFGYYTTMLSEGYNDVHIEYPSGTLNKVQRITVDLSNHTSMYLVKTAISSQVKISALSVNVKDVLNRDIPAINVTITGQGLSWIARSEITDGAGNVLFPSLPYQDYPVYNITVRFGLVKIGSFNVTINSDVQHADFKATVQYIFKDVVTSMSIIDHFGVGYRANITIADQANSTVLTSVISTGSGQQTIDLDEGTYTARIYHGTSMVNSSSFTIRKESGIAFLFITGIDAYPDTHSSPVTIHVKDGLGRMIGNIIVNLTSNKTSYQSTTDGAGKAIFSSVYWGFDQWFNISFSDQVAMLHSSTIQVNKMTALSWNMTGQYMFKNIQVQISILDVNDRGFSARVEALAINGSIVFSGTTTANGIIMMTIDEGNYTIMVFSGNGTVLGSKIVEVMKDVGTSFSVSTSIDAYPVTFTMPLWGWIAIAIGGIVIAAVSIYSTKKRRAWNDRVNLEVREKRGFFEDIDGLRMVLAINDSGIEIASIAPQIDLKAKSELASGLINALSAFGNELDKKAGSIKSFHFEGFSATMIKGKYLMLAILDDTSLGRLFKERVIKFLDEYETWHKNELAHFNGNVTSFVDFIDKFGMITGAELIEPCTWRFSEIESMTLNSELRGVIKSLRKKRDLDRKNVSPSIRDFLSEVRSLGKAPSGNIYIGMYSIYEKGYILSTKAMTAAKEFERSVLNLRDTVDADEFREEQDREISRLGDSIKSIDEQRQKAQGKVAEGRLTKEQFDVVDAKYASESKVIEDRIKQIAALDMETWKRNGRKFDMPTSEAKQ